MSFQIRSNDAEHRQTSEGFAQGAEHGETTVGLENINVWVKPSQTQRRL